MPVIGSVPVVPTAPVVSPDGYLTVTVEPSASTLILTDFTAYTSAAQIFNVTVVRTTYATATTQGTVRGFDTRFAPRGIALGVDFEAALGVPVSYQVTAYDITGAVLVTSTATPTLSVPATVGTAWLKSLRTPVLSQSLTVATLPDWTRTIPLGALTPLGSSFPSVSAGQRSARTGTLSVHTVDKAGRVGLDKLLSAPGPYLLQWSPATDEPDRYVVVGDQATSRWTRLASEQGRTHSLPLTEVSRPATLGSAVAIPGRTWADAAPGHTIVSVPGRIVDFAGF